MRNIEHLCDEKSRTFLWSWKRYLYQHHVSFLSLGIFHSILFISIFLNFVLMLNAMSLFMLALCLSRVSSLSPSFRFISKVRGKHFQVIIDWNTFVWYTSLFHLKGCCTQYLDQWTSALPTMLQPLPVLSDVQNMFKCRRLFKKCWLTLKMRLKLKKKKQPKKLFVKLIFINRKLFEKFLQKPPPKNGLLQ
jgi:hypothetical protein